MDLSLTWQKTRFQVVDPPIDLAIPLDFEGPQPSAYGMPKAQREVFQVGSFTGDVRQGGSVNVETYQISPHGNGTHTECVGHLTEERLYVHDLLRESWFMATLLSIAPERASNTEEHYDPPLAATDRVITRQQLQMAAPSLLTPALVLRSMAPGASPYRDYSQQAPPFFTLEAMTWLRAQGVEHLLVDFPSVDRLHDEGKLRNHRIFWGLAPGQQRISPEVPPKGSITEMIMVPSEVADGLYLLNLQVAPFLSDAAPSRPRLFGLEELPAT